MALFTKNEVMNFLPHRSPFLFVDEVESITDRDGNILTYPASSTTIPLEGLQVRGTFNVLESLEILAGHFPGNPVLPGVVQVEMMAQVSCMALKMVVAPQVTHQNIQVALLKVSEARFRRPIRPGICLQIICKCTKVRGNTVCYEARIEAGGEVYAEATLMANYNTIA